LKEKVEEKSSRPGATG